MADESQHEPAKLEDLQAAVQKAEEEYWAVRNRGVCHTDQIDAYKKLEKACAAVEECKKMRAGKSNEEKPTVREGTTDKAQTETQQQSTCTDDVSKQEHADTAASLISSTPSSETAQNIPMQASTEQSASAQPDSQRGMDGAEIRSQQGSPFPDEVNKQQHESAAASPTSMSSASETLQNIPMQPSREQSASEQHDSQRRTDGAENGAEIRSQQGSPCPDASAAGSPTSMSSASETLQNIPMQPSTEQSASVQQVSQRRIKANRKNALSSTGPRSARGKNMAARNALKHGLLARSAVITLGPAKESKAEFEELLSGLQEYFAPVGTAEELLVEEIAVCYWMERRAQLYENFQICTQAGLPDTPATRMTNGLPTSWRVAKATCC